MLNKTYRPEIDGLRAIAVIAVLAYHLDFWLTPGGFVGVDVFFVISGFLMTRKIYAEVARTGKFDFGSFYGRRVRRLAPALLVTVGTTLVAGYYISPPLVLEELAKSSVASVLSLSNIFFWMHSGYFDPSNQNRALLHTWSLSLEEQFYILWPLFLLSAMRLKARVPFCIALVSLTSLALSVAFLRYSASIYYLIPFRMFEFGIGGMVVFCEGKFRLSQMLKAAISAVGLAVIVATIILWNSNTVFPSYNALAPCIATGAVIFAGRVKYISWLLTNPVSRFFGAVSYSVYLVHWPIIVFCSYIVMGDTSQPLRLGMFVASIFSGVFLYYIVENPIRTMRFLPNLRGPRFAAAVGLGTTLVMVPAIGAALNEGWKWRYPKEVRRMLDQTHINDGIVFPTKNCFKGLGAPTEISPACYTSLNNGKKNVLLLGDSTVNHLLLGLTTLIGNQVNLLEFASSVCPPVQGSSNGNPECPADMKYFFSEVLPRNHYDLVIVSSTTRWRQMLDGFPETLREFSARGMPVVLIGQTIWYTQPPRDLVPRAKSLGDLDPIMRDALREGCEGERGLDTLVPPDRFFSVKRLLCRQDGSGTPIYALNGTLINSDHIHLNGVGSLFIGRQLIAWLHDRALL